MVQLYIRDLVGSVTRPVKELKGFAKIELAPDEEQKVTFVLTADDLAFFTARKQWEAEPGEFAVFVGTSSTEVSEGRFILSSDTTE